MKNRVKRLLIIVMVVILSYQAGRYKASFHQPYIIQMSKITQASLDLCIIDGDCMDIQELGDDWNSDDYRKEDL